MHKDTLDRAEIYPNFWDCSIQTFNDQDKNERKQSRIVKMNEENLEKCVKLQSLMPYGIYFSVNPMNEGKRDKENVKFIQVWICDIDTGTKEEQEKLIENAPLRPTLVSESKKGFHIFYQAVKPITEEEYADGNFGLANYYHGDIKVCKDTARVLRIPGFYHMKGEPFLVKYRDDLSSGVHYTPNQMYASFPKPVEEKPTQKVEIKKIEKFWSGSDSYWEKVNRLNNKQMLRELSGTRFMNGETIDFKPCSTGEQIYCNGKPTSCWIDKAGMIGSSDDGGPHWICWLRRYARQRGQELDFKDLAKRLNANHPELGGEKKFDIKQVQKREVKGDATGFVYPGEVFEDFECFMSGELVTIVAETNSGKTTFAMDMISRNAKLGRRGLYINLEFNIENVWKDKRLWINGKTKSNLTDLNPMSSEEKERMDAYIKKSMSTFDSYSEPGGMDLEDLEELITKKTDEGYELFVIDSFSKIHGNLDGKNARGSQNRCMEEMQELVQKLNVAVVMLHHTNKNGTFEGTQKIADLSNVFILIQKEESDYGEEYRKYILSKDKFVHNKVVNAIYRKGVYELFST